ncbi:zinc finger domain-containing protein [Blastococcus brunescens]|uniref:Zinc finger domain-containing protein n=1 Tax=Blastococcus brunescens TaxID=1564165 RepID=A0ABZ1B7V5_9ACTN|nr:zinc finger domain-containing protein [Blastococcus sp. BMG 8361]WRL66824.1 zinc finger domain-containing protein [Blastococcus sp. BMG 8361]
MDRRRPRRSRRVGRPPRPHRLRGAGNPGGDRDPGAARPGPAAPRADGGIAHSRIARSRTAIGALLMDQSVLAGVGNVYRAELLFRHGVSPFRPGRAVEAPLWQEMWVDLVMLLRSGVRMGRIVTTRAEDRSRRRSPVQRDDAHYVYRRTGLPCRICGTEIRTEVMVGRNLYWCPVCQAV